MQKPSNQKWLDGFLGIKLGVSKQIRNVLL